MTADLDLAEPTSDENRLPPTSPRGVDLLIGIPIIWGIELLLGVLLVLRGGTSIKLVEHPVAVLVMTLISGAFTLLVSSLVGVFTESLR